MSTRLIDGIKIHIKYSSVWIQDGNYFANQSDVFITDQSGRHFYSRHPYHLTDEDAYRDFVQSGQNPLTRRDI